MPLTTKAIGVNTLSTTSIALANDPVAGGIKAYAESLVPVTHALTPVTTLVDADEMAVVNSQTSFTYAKITWANIKATLRTYFDTLYQPYDPQLSSLIRQRSISANYATIMGDIGYHILHPSSDATARTVTVAANANVAYPLGTAITFINANGAGVLTIAIDTDTMRIAGAGTTGNRTLAANGCCTAVKIAATEWIISGTGLS